MARLKEFCRWQNVSHRCIRGTLKWKRNKSVWKWLPKIHWNSNSIWIRNFPLNNSIWTHPQLEHEGVWFPHQHLLSIVFHHRISFFRYLYFSFFSFSFHLNHSFKIKVLVKFYLTTKRMKLQSFLISKSKNKVKKTWKAKKNL